MHSIRIKIMTITIVAIVISVLALGGIAIYTIGEESNRSSAEKMALISSDEQKTLDAYLDSLQQSVDMVAHVADDSLATNGSALNVYAKHGTPTADQKAQADAYLANLGSALQEFFSSVANHTNGVVTYYYCVNPDVATPEKGFFYSKMGSDGFEEQEPLDAATLDPNDIEHYTWYYTPIERGESCWIGPYKAHFLNEVWTVSYVTPIYKDGLFLGVLGMDILFDTMIDHVDSVPIYESGFICLADSDGVILHHPAYEIGSSPAVAEPTLDADIFQLDSSEGALIRYDAEGEHKQLAFSTLSNGMKLVVSAPVSEITESQRHLVQVILLVTIVILALFTTLTLLSMRVVTRPLLELTAASQQLAAGNYDVELDYDGKDEVGTLTDAFRKMRDHLKQYISDLNNQVTTDSLTGIKNKGAFDAAIQKLDADIRYLPPGMDPHFAIVMFDSNSLKEINDEHGHDRGDLYLRRASKAICDVFAHSPVFRVGGDEFAVILEGRDYEQRDELLKAFDKEAERVNAAATVPWDKVDIAKGMAEYRPDTDENAEHVLHRADELMYLEKRLYRLSIGQL